MNRQDAATTKALKEIQGALDLTNEQTVYLKHFLYCMYDLGRSEGRKRSEKRKPVEQLFGGIVIGEFESEAQAAAKTGYNPSSISRLIKTKQKSRAGFQFRLKYPNINTTWLK